jgi:hypothetical protein
MAMVSSFLRDRLMVDEVDGVKSAHRYLSSRVPQGCIPSPLFFSMFINDFCSLILFSKFHFYADDLQIYLSGDRKDLDEMISAHSEDLAAISQWSAENGLLLNPLKLQAILISSSAVGMVLPSLFLGTEEITWCDSVTDLGVVIDGPLRFDRQVTKVCSRVYATPHRLRLLKFVKPKRVRLKLCKALLLSYFFYSISSTGGLQ